MSLFDISKRRLKELYHRDGLSTYEIGRRFGVSATTIQTKLREYDIEVKSSSERQIGRHGQISNKNKWTSYDDQILIKLRSAGFSVADIALIMVRPKSVIKKQILKKDINYARK